MFSAPAYLSSDCESARALTADLEVRPHLVLARAPGHGLVVVAQLRGHRDARAGLAPSALDRCADALVRMHGSQDWFDTILHGIGVQALRRDI